MNEQLLKMNGLSVGILDLYKKSYPVETGKIMREKYENGLIRNEHEFKEVLNNVLFGSKRS